MALFQHCSVLFELKGLPFKEKKKIKLAVTDNGGTISFVANKECSLIVTSAVSSLTPGRLRNIVKHQIPVVGLNYVHRCVEADCRLPVEDFTLDISAANDPPATYKDKWSVPSLTSKPIKNQVKPPEAMSVTHSAELLKGRGSVIENNRVYNDTDRDLPKFPENFQVAKYSVFQKSSGHSWCLLELQSAKREKGRKYRLVKRWKDDLQSKATVKNQMVFVSTSEEALKVFKAMTDSVRAEGLKQQSHGPPQVTEMGSAPLQQLLLEEKLHTGALSPEVGQFVELLWQEALGCINLILTTPVHKLSLNDVPRAEGLLLQIQRRVMDNKKDEQCAVLWTEYTTLIPLRIPGEPDLPSISKNFDLCQLIRDILNMSEMTLGSTVLSSVGKYRALRCSIEAVPKDSSEFDSVASLLQHSKVQVHQILRVNRPPELQSFKSELGNLKSLLHSSSPHNFVGILSRGLLLPGVAVLQHGIQRTDAGDLGSGIYFSDDVNTTLKYSQCSITDGSRLVLVCDIALGRCMDLYKKDLTLTQAPKGHDSVHGVQSTLSHQSDFKGDEYVVYSPDQVKLKYVVRLSLEDDELKTFTPEISHSEEPLLPSPPDQDMGEVDDGFVDIKNPLDNVTAGLLNSSGQQIPLQAVHVKCKLVDLLAQVIIFQQYTNKMSTAIEAKYVFPLDDSAAVCGFEAFINGKHVVGQVKEKETARREYKQAIEKGHGAYLMDQDAPDVFTISVGNLPPNATVLIKVTFVSELIVKDGSIFFSLPSSVAPWQESAALNQTTQVTVEKVCVTDEEASARDFNLDMSIEMPHEITEVKCITHQVKMKKTDCKAVVSVFPGEVMGPEGFQLLVTLTEVHVPRMWVEKHPSKDSQACMLVFYPKFEATSQNTSDEVVLLIDASQSMKGESFNTARMIALQILKTLDPNISVNVIFFGADHTEAFLSARPIDQARHEVKNFIKHFSSVGGSTELWRPLRTLSLLPPSRGTRNLLLLSDGHIQNTELTLQLLRDHAPHTRLFTCGLSSTANRHMLRALAQAGGGAYEFFDTKSKHTWSEKVKAQVKRIQAPGSSSVSVKWQQFNPTAPPPVQAPKHLHALFNDCHTLVFGFVPHCTKATLMGNLNGQEIETMVSTSELQKTKGTFLHKLTARAIIRDFEDGSLDSNAVLHEEKKAELKSYVIELSKEFSILSQFTSFVAIEEREWHEEAGFTDIPKLIDEEDVDFLPYMSWESTEETLDADEDENLGSISSSEESESRSAHESSESDDDMGFMFDTPVSSLSPSPMETEEIEVSEIPYDLLTDSAIMREPSFEGYCSIQLDSVQEAPRFPAPPPPPPPPPPGARSRIITEQAFGYSAKERSPTRSSSFGYSAREMTHSLHKARPLSRNLIRLGSLEKREEAGPSQRALPPPRSPSPELLYTLSASHVEPKSYDRERPIVKEGALKKRRPQQTRPQPPSPSMHAPPKPRQTQDAEVMRMAPEKIIFSSPEKEIMEEPQIFSPKIRTWSAVSHFPAPSVFSQPCPPPVPVTMPRIPVMQKIDSNVFNLNIDSCSNEMIQKSTAFGQDFSSHLFLERFDAGIPFAVAARRSFDGPCGSAQTNMEVCKDSVQELNKVQFAGGKFVPVAAADLSSTYGLFGSAQTNMEVCEDSVQDVDELQFGGIVDEEFAEADSLFTERKPLKPLARRSAPSGDTKHYAEKNARVCRGGRRGKTFSIGFLDDNTSKWTKIFSLQNPEGYWEVTPELGTLLNCNIYIFANDFLKKRGIASLGERAHADILKLLATLLVLQLMRLDKLKEGLLLRTLFCLEDTPFRPEHWEAVNRAVEWARWADRQYPCVYSRLEFGLSWDSSTKQLLGAERVHHCSPLTGLNLNPRPAMVQS